METKGLTCKIPLELHDRITAEIRQNESTIRRQFVHAGTCYG